MGGGCVCRRKPAGVAEIAGGRAGRELLPVAKVWPRVMIVHVIRCVTNPLERRCLQPTRGPEWRQCMYNGDRADTTQLLLLGQTLEEINCFPNESEHKLKQVIRWARIRSNAARSHTILLTAPRRARGIDPPGTARAQPRHIAPGPRRSCAPPGRRPVPGPTAWSSGQRGAP